MCDNLCVSSFPDSCSLDRCPKIKALEPPFAFICGICGQSVYIEEWDNANCCNCYETQENKRICGACVDTITVWDALIFLGCLVPWE